MLERGLRRFLIVALALSGAVLAWRAIAGPFRLISVPVNSPVNAQGIFGLSLAILLVLNGSLYEESPRKNARHCVAWLAAILLLTVAVLGTALRFPLVFDDYTLARYGQGLNVPMAKYYFSQPGGDGFYRPIGYLSFGLDSIWADHDPLRWHLFSLLLHLANIVLVWMLARRLLQDRIIAVWAAALFALHGTVLLTATFLAARFDVLSVFFVLAGLVLFLRYVQERNRFMLVTSLACACLGFLTKEVAFSFPLLATVVSGRNARVHWRVLAGYFILAGAVFSYRCWLVGGIGGYRDAVTGAPTILRPNYLGLLKGFGLRIWSVFDFPVNWSREPEPWLMVSLVAYLVVLSAVALRAHASRAKLLLTLAFTGVALLPVAHLLLVDASLLGASRFYLAWAGLAMLLAAAMQGLERPGRAVAGVVLIIFQVAALVHNLSIWHDTAALADRTCAMVARTGTHLSASSLPVQIDGVPFLRNGFEACVEFHRTQIDYGKAGR